MMDIILAALEEPLAAAWEHHCGAFDQVTIHRGSILDLRCDAIVSPANSFGFMDGGIDLLYSRHFGWHLQEHLQQLIIDRHHGELLIGTAEIVPTQDQQIPYLIAAPTMRVPMILRETVNPYLACRAALRLAGDGTFPDGERRGEPVRNVVRSIAFPGLGTGVGRVDPDTCAYQMRVAIEEVVLGRPSFPGSWREAQLRHQQLYGGDMRDLQFE